MPVPRPTPRSCSPIKTLGWATFLAALLFSSCSGDPASEGGGRGDTLGDGRIVAESSEDYELALNQGANTADSQVTTTTPVDVLTLETTTTTLTGSPLSTTVPLPSFPLNTTSPTPAAPTTILPRSPAGATYPAPTPWEIVLPQAGEDPDCSNPPEGFVLEDLARSPRVDEDAEILAWEASANGSFGSGSLGGIWPVAAPQSLYEQVTGDLATIRERFSGLTVVERCPTIWLSPDCGFHPSASHLLSYFSLGFIAKFEDSKIDAILEQAKCWVQWANLEVKNDSGYAITFRSNKIFNSYLYKDLFGELYQTPHRHNINPSPNRLELSDICMELDGEDRFYIFYDPYYKCDDNCKNPKIYRAFQADRVGTRHVGDWYPGDGSDAPEWWHSHPECVSRLGD